MADITIKMVKQDSISPPTFKGISYVPCTTSIDYSIRNIDSLTYDLDSPVQVIPIPETQVNVTGSDQVNSEGEGPIILKIEGNSMNINIRWTIVDEPTSVVNGGVPALQCVCNVCECPSSTVKGIHTANDQLLFLFNTFQNRSINANFEYNGSGFSDVPVLVQKVSATLESSSPVTYKGEIRLSVGDTTITADEGDSG